MGQGPVTPAGQRAGRRRERQFAFEPAHFAYIAELVQRLAGIHLTTRKAEMVYSRLSRRLRELGLDGFDAYCARLGDDPDGEELNVLVNALTTNLTHFFREPHHFEHLGSVLVPAVRGAQAAAAKPRLRIWSAGCSTGEEPYSIAMTLQGLMPDLGRWDARVLATDIDTAVLDAAAKGRYRADAADGIPDEWRRRFVEPGRGGAPFAIAPAVRRLVTFKPLNLIEDWPMRGPFDAIFCRNVLIYFDRGDRIRTVDRFAGLLAEGGFLYLGHSESLFGISSRFRQVGPTTYRRVA
ncbi:MAG TPA: protein-glutamate O-methyltransferase CheR [Alphaproteobacteria bacterium]|nr:protein-glutamate O-methyltransferase CheR [Alphaproteobacteria bacterium]